MHLHFHSDVPASSMLQHEGLMLHHHSEIGTISSYCILMSHSNSSHFSSIVESTFSMMILLHKNLCSILFNDHFTLQEFVLHPCLSLSSIIHSNLGHMQRSLTSITNKHMPILSYFRPCCQLLVVLRGETRACIILHVLVLYLVDVECTIDRDRYGVLVLVRQCLYCTGIQVMQYYSQQAVLVVLQQYSDESKCDWTSLVAVYVLLYLSFAPRCAHVLDYLYSSREDSAGSSTCTSVIESVIYLFSYSHTTLSLIDRCSHLAQQITY